MKYCWKERKTPLPSTHPYFLSVNYSFTSCSAVVLSIWLMEVLTWTSTLIPEYTECAGILWLIGMKKKRACAAVGRRINQRPSVWKANTQSTRPGQQVQVVPTLGTPSSTYIFIRDMMLRTSLFISVSTRQVAVVTSLCSVSQILLLSFLSDLTFSLIMGVLMSLCTPILRRMYYALQIMVI